MNKYIIGQLLIRQDGYNLYPYIVIGYDFEDNTIIIKSKINKYSSYTAYAVEKLDKFIASKEELIEKYNEIIEKNKYNEEICNLMEERYDLKRAYERYKECYEQFEYFDHMTNRNELYELEYVKIKKGKKRRLKRIYKHLNPTLYNYFVNLDKKELKHLKNWKGNKKQLTADYNKCIELFDTIYKN